VLQVYFINPQTIPDRQVNPRINHAFHSLESMDEVEKDEIT